MKWLKIAAKFRLTLSKTHEEEVQTADYGKFW